MPGGLAEICVPITIVNDNTSETCVEFFNVGISTDAVVGSPSEILVNDTPHVEGDVLELELMLLGCATVQCDDAVQPFSEDCES